MDNERYGFLIFNQTSKLVLILKIGGRCVRECKGRIGMKGVDTVVLTEDKQDQGLLFSAKVDDLFGGSQMSSRKLVRTKD